MRIKQISSYLADNQNINDQMNQCTAPCLCLQDVLFSFSNVVDLMHPSFNKHHAYVAYIAYRIADMYGCNKIDIQNIVLAALLHDIGAFSQRERLSLLEFEGDDTKDDSHAEIGYKLLRNFPPLATAATYIRFHHQYWQPTKFKQTKQANHVLAPIGSYIIHLADRIAVLIRQEENILSQIPRIKSRIAEHHNVFMPELVAAFQEVAEKEEFWLNIVYESLNSILKDEIGLKSILINKDQIDSLTELFRRIIDFRSAFTSMHSNGVAAIASILAKIADFAPEDIHMIRLAGYMHDLGKIGIGLEILEKPEPLVPHEDSVMRAHPYHTDRILRPLPYFDTMRIWAAQHHECLNGKGYPFHTHGDMLSLGSRIIAEADVFTALFEDRPYRKGMPIQDVLTIMQQMVDDKRLDPEIYSWISCNVEEISHECFVIQQASKLEYRSFFSNAKQ